VSSYAASKAGRNQTGAISVARPHKWGNPFKVGERTAEEAVRLYRQWLPDTDLYRQLSDLTGHDLMCWCPLDQPCHADANHRHEASSCTGVPLLALPHPPQPSRPTPSHLPRRDTGTDVIAVSNVAIDRKVGMTFKDLRQFLTDCMNRDMPDHVIHHSRHRGHGQITKIKAEAWEEP
jgi:Domain of unknown function (DUF4326)